jgi:4-oxalocrotonate tautomerase
MGAQDMPIIEVRFIRDVVCPTQEDKNRLIERLTETFIEVCGEVTRPFVYCLINETPQMQWGISGVPMPDLEYLTGERRAQEIANANTLMTQMAAQAQRPPSGGAGGRGGEGGGAE